ncbi:UDP-N-acetylmuramoyl-tripeptide--D-alanyl-D-alanine ligase [Clostridium baratii]|uniref:UDP-N-acetylmuramoyl-tripeptide--D-alanyl-D-alanine ligase n=1 Tax=Clostridium baratii str. Sullivan TaxID=1415775 RepID=A0A0A7FVJ4_9CLOT|nr:UDP-N-acetylmuramoyl-tripeptide--D-alanyl-D-alanine ligase [Clostridium baratii]AIY82960.1 UDP-N-acetylmuramoyl-tripeptide--D-alanyl-D-alanine ligase family protein [Clostridium baratii str. Sullivan]MDU4910298.1 UDP-N-acetylmuramoyl-tripeptide--D-alanyl-D-alanine ligase [Clostridium baratii]CUO97889.1 UDP-N-acetylmuramoyl-tripeptide--D-alanyl-D-alanine ligase [Clostridium baratii]
MELTFNELLKYSNGEVIVDNDNKEFNKLSTDTRKIEKGNIFLALKGENFNGNKYVKEAFSKGASIAIVDEVLFNEEDVDGVVIKVESGKDALLQIAKGYREKLGLKVVGITGSTGKTSTKDLVSAFLSGKYKVFKTKGNFNNEIGLPLMVLELDSSIDVAVLEMGMSDFNEIHNLVNCARPDIALITNIGVSHIENLKTRDNILKAKMEITDYFNKNNTLVINCEDDKLSTIGDKEYEIVKIGYNHNYDYYASNIKLTNESTSFDLNCDGEVHNITLDMVGKHNVLNALLGIAASFKLGLTVDEMKDGLKNMEATSMRLEFISGDGIEIINDCYNASPDSMKAALDVLNNREGRKIAILGTMRELGDESKRCHREVSEYASSKVDMLISCGEFIDDFKEGFEKEEIKLYNTKIDLINDLDSIIKPNDVILVKASRGEKFEEIVEALKNIKR